MKRKIKHSLTGIVAIFALVAAYYLLYSIPNDQLDIGDEPYILTVDTGSNLTRVTYKLHEEDIISHPRSVLTYARLFGIGDKIHAGEYELTSNMTVDEFIKLLDKGEVVQYSLTIIEGWTFKQLIQAVRDNPNLKHTLDGLSPDEIMVKLGYAGQHPEGRFLPDTYFFTKGMSDVDFLQRAYTAMDDFIKQEWEKRDIGLPVKNSYEALVLASIVEKETGQVSERGKIAGVFTLRLEKRMRLQSDPTVIYGLGERYKGNIKRRHLKEDTPYNTYTRFGLPPTPIAMPGKDAIMAVLHPERGEYLYFVAKGDGSHHFSTTLEEHNRAVRDYQINRRNKPYTSSP